MIKIEKGIEMAQKRTGKRKYPFLAALKIIQNNDYYIDVRKDGDCILDGRFTIKELEAVLEILKAETGYCSLGEE